MNNFQPNAMNPGVQNLRSQAALSGSSSVQGPNQFYQNLSRSFNAMNGGRSAFKPIGGGYSSFRQQSAVAPSQAVQGPGAYYQNIQRLNSQSQPPADYRRQAATELLSRQAYNSKPSLSFGGFR